VGVQPPGRDLGLGSARKDAGTLPPRLRVLSAARVPTKGSRGHEATQGHRRIKYLTKETQV